MILGPGWAASESGPSGGGRNQGLDTLVAKPDHLVRSHIATDHAIRQPWLERLIDDASTVREIRFTPRQEIGERQIFRQAATDRL